MAIYHLHTSPASRSSGKSAVAMAAYRSGVRLLDERTGEIKDYTRKQGIIETAIFYPQAVEFDRQVLWNMAEAAEKRRDARIAREIRIALPHELDQEERSKLVKDFAQELVNRYGIAVDLSIHQPDRQGDNRNFHAHLLLTTRQITPDGLSEKSDLEKSDKALKQSGKLNGKEQITEIRESWQNMCNLALERQGREERISAQSYKTRGIGLQPTIHLGPAVTAMERRGMETINGTYNRVIKKRNLSRILLRRRYRVRREIELFNRQKQELEREISKEDALDLKQEIQPQESSKIEQIITPEIEQKAQKEPINIEELLSDNTQRQPENSHEMDKQGLSVESLLNRHNEPQESLEKGSDDKRKLSVEDLLNSKPEMSQERGLSRDKDGLER